MKVVYSPRYTFDLGLHVFPVQKYEITHALLHAEGTVSDEDCVEPPPATWDEIETVHTPEYLEKLRAGRLTIDEQADLEIAWSAELVEGFRLMVGGTIAAARLALAGAPADRDCPAWNVVAHLGGGFHHAFPNHGEGFCMFNDVAIAIRVLQREGAIARPAIIDCDVHQGNGTAAIFRGDPSVFTFSIHQFNNYPAVKPKGSLDVPLPDAAGDEEYLAALSDALPKVFAANPDVVFYLAGADPYREDQLGGLALTREGLQQRDWMVLKAAREAQVPTVVALAGGYARRVDDTVAIHAATVQIARRISAL